MATKEDVELTKLVSQFWDDPLGYVQASFPWQEKGTELANDDGPDVWQREFLMDLGAAVKRNNFDGIHAVPALRYAVASGHGIGKGVMMAWLACWIMDTRPNSQGTITANTGPQLASKTWPAVRRWRDLSITRGLWVGNAEQIYHKENKEQWFLKCQTCAEENSEAFAGQHQKDSTSYYLFDESSAIPAKIFEKADGGLTDGEPMIFAFGNPTRNTGEFYEICFGSKKHRWNVRSIDSRTCKFPNKEEIEQWIRDYGIDSDRIAYMVLGQPPKTSELQLIGRDLVDSAREAVLYPQPEDEPLIAGVDVADGGSAFFVVRFRRGMDARTIPPIRIAGSRIDPPAMIAKLADLLRERTAGKKIAMMFVDRAFGGPLVERLHTLGHENVVEVNFGGKSPDPAYLNMRSYMYGKELKDWLRRGGCIDKADEKLKTDLIAPGYHFNQSNQIVMEEKALVQKRTGMSLDDGDSLALTFAHPVAPVFKVAQRPQVEYSWLAG